MGASRASTKNCTHDGIAIFLCCAPHAMHTPSTATVIFSHGADAVAVSETLLIFRITSNYCDSMQRSSQCSARHYMSQDASGREGLWGCATRNKQHTDEPRQKKISLLSTWMLSVSTAAPPSSLASPSPAAASLPIPGSASHASLLPESCELYDTRSFALPCSSLKLTQRFHGVRMRLIQCFLRFWDSLQLRHAMPFVSR